MDRVVWNFSEIFIVSIRVQVAAEVQDGRPPVHTIRSLLQVLTVLFAARAYSLPVDLSHTWIRWHLYYCSLEKKS